VSCVPRHGHAHPFCPSRLGLAGSRRRDVNGTCPADRGDDCSGRREQNAERNFPRDLLDMFGKNSAGHSGDYPGASPGYAPKLVAAEPEMRAKCECTVGYVNKTPAQACRLGAGSEWTCVFLFPHRNVPPQPGQSEKCFPDEPHVRSQARGGLPPAPACLLSTVFCLLCPLPRHYRLLDIGKGRRVEANEVDAVRHQPAALSRHLNGDTSPIFHCPCGADLASAGRGHDLSVTPVSRGMRSRPRADRLPSCAESLPPSLRIRP